MSPYVVCATLLLAALAVTPSHAFATGAPNSPEICQSLTPKHGKDGQTKASPYKLTVSTATTSVDKPVLVTIEGVKSDAQFVGFLLQARVNGKPIGTFDVSGAGGLAQATRCSIDKDTVTHTSNAKKSKLTVKWTAPAGIQDTDVTFTATVLESGYVFWVAQKSAVLTVKA